MAVESNLSGNVDGNIGHDETFCEEVLECFQVIYAVSFYTGSIAYVFCFKLLLLTNFVLLSFAPFT